MKRNLAKLFGMLMSLIALAIAAGAGTNFDP